MNKFGDDYKVEKFAETWIESLENDSHFVIGMFPS